MKLGNIRLRLLLPVIHTIGAISPGQYKILNSLASRNRWSTLIGLLRNHHGFHTSTPSTVFKVYNEEGILTDCEVDDAYIATKIPKTKAYKSIW